jgi:hypothetical protein
LALVFLTIDVCAFLSLPAGETRQGQDEFVAWVDTYMKGHSDQPYQYRGLDVYGARCAVLHVFGADADFHQRHPDAKRFVYHTGGRHGFDHGKNAGLVVIALARRPPSAGREPPPQASSGPPDRDASAKRRIELSRVRYLLRREPAKRQA